MKCGRRSFVRAKRSTLQPLIREQVALGAELMTDAHSGYDGLEGEYVRRVIDHAEAYAIGSVHTIGMENFWSLLDRMINGSYVSVDPEHLCKYVDEEAFRFNEREGTPLGRFLKVACNVSGKRLTWEELTARPAGTPPRRGGGKHLAP